jgi:predicted dehydrogenase
MKPFPLLTLLSLLVSSMTPARAQTPAAAPFRLVMLDPGHFHAALLQKTMYPQIDPTVRVYAPAGPDVQEHLKRVEAYNARADQPTHWKAITYTGPDFLARLLQEKAGNVVVMSGNNRDKPARLLPLVEAGIDVFADKPMVIEPEGFAALERAFATAKAKGAILYDIMTERSEITNALQREFALQPAVFGQLVEGTPENPAVVMESVHYYYKTVSGSPLKRPAWFFDVSETGEGLSDVGTHLVDLVQWECFPDQTIDYQRDIQILGARHWPTTLTAVQFKATTGLDSFPSALRGSVKNGVLSVFGNNEVTYRLKGVHVKVTARWDYEAAPGSGDTHYALLRGTKCNLVIRQGAAEGWKPTLYLEAAPGTDPLTFRRVLLPALLDIQQKYPGIDVEPRETSWRVVVPAKYDIGHEAHFAEVTNRFLSYLATRRMPEWEVPNMLAKYYTTTKCIELARRAH